VTAARQKELNPAFVSEETEEVENFNNPAGSDGATQSTEELPLAIATLAVPEELAVE
jgi:hypothetical protein